MTCVDPLEGMNAGERCYELSMLLDGFARNGLSSHWAASELYHVFGHQETAVKFATLFGWGTVIAARQRNKRKEWNNRMVLWHLNESVRRLHDQAYEDGQDDYRKLLDDLTTFLNYAGEGQESGAVALCRARTDDADEDDAAYWWHALAVGIGMLAEDNDDREAAELVSAYETSCPDPTLDVLGTGANE